MYPNLKIRVWMSGIRQYRLAQTVGIHETLLSKILNGSRRASPSVRARIAEALGSDEAWLFNAEYSPEPAVKKEAPLCNESAARVGQE